ncbi:GGDEF domain-containing protein [Mariniblastus sp.]|nr:GGDEF domain-containing protein [Mariniblastus sp.]
MGVGLLCGFFIGRVYTLTNETGRLKKDREATLKSLMSVMKSTHQLNEDVDVHHTALQTAKQELELLDRDDNLDELQTALVSNIAQVVQCNRKLENDLVVSRYKLENQAQELDRSRREARTDALCDIGNRKAVDETLQFMVSRFSQNQTASFGLMLIDIDHFKRINDTFGHQAGDEVLASISLALKGCVRPEDFVGRLGGDEFCIMLDGLTDQNAQMVGTRIRSTIELYDFTINESGQSTVVTMSMGLTTVRPEDDAVALYERADKALYESKRLGRNRLFTISEHETEASDEVKEQQQVSYKDFKAQVGQEGLSE